jgi:preprotein translocase subunit YajC
MAGCACALKSGADLQLKGEQRMSVATSLALWVFLQAAGGGSSITMLLPLLLIPVLYLVMIRPQQKRQKQWQAMLAGIKAGDRVTTAGGIRGIILSIKDDVIVIRVAPDGIKMEVAKNAIASVTTQDPTAGA